MKHRHISPPAAIRAAMLALITGLAVVLAALAMMVTTQYWQINTVVARWQLPGPTQPALPMGLTWTETGGDHD